MNAGFHSVVSDWQALADAGDDTAFHAAWLAYAARSVTGAREAVLVLRDGLAEGDFRARAVWPQDRQPSAALAAACERALDLQTKVSERSGDLAIAVHPLRFQGVICGVVGFAGETLAQASTVVAWGSGWLLTRLAGRERDDGEVLRDRLFVTLDLMVAALEEDQPEAAIHSVVTETAVRLGCDRVSVGFVKRNIVRLAALSHSAELDHRSDLGKALEAAMNEAMEQTSPILLADGKVEEDDGRLLAIREHRRLSRDFGSAVVISVPFADDRGEGGVMVFEFAVSEVPAGTRGLCETLTPVLGRVLLDRRRAARGIFRRLADGTAEQVRKLFGPRYAVRKLLALAVVAVAVFLAVATGDFRVSADAHLEGATRRALAAPFDGFVADAFKRAGQTVEKGEVLATLDDRELKLEVARWNSQREQYAQQAQAAEAQADLAEIRIAQAQMRQAGAQMALAQAKLERARITAPFNGLVLEGDLSQSLGAAVRKGDTLFEIAPLDAYRVVLAVDESDISYIRVGQAGNLVLAAMPDAKLPFNVTLVTPVAEARDGKNSFRVEAHLDTPSLRLRPGMEGVGKVLIGDRHLAWIWTRRIWDWIRLQAWSWAGV